MLKKEIDFRLLLEWKATRTPLRWYTPEFGNEGSLFKLISSAISWKSFFQNQREKLASSKSRFSMDEFAKESFDVECILGMSIIVSLAPSYDEVRLVPHLYRRILDLRLVNAEKVDSFRTSLIYQKMIQRRYTQETPPTETKGWQFLDSKDTLMVLYGQFYIFYSHLLISPFREFRSAYVEQLFKKCSLFELGPKEYFYMDFVFLTRNGGYYLYETKDFIHPRDFKELTEWMESKVYQEFWNFDSTPGGVEDSGDFKDLKDRCLRWVGVRIRRRFYTLSRGPDPEYVV